MPSPWRSEGNRALPRPSSRLTSAQWQEVCRRYADGETATSLALAFGVPASVIRNRITSRNPGRFRPHA